jgi:flavin reductase (DIM6/NTAB) family NADH-FMN oxidoreductase RutF
MTMNTASFTADDFRAVLGHFATGVTVVAAMDGSEPAGLAVQSFCSLSLDPPLVLFCPSKTSTSWPRIESVGRYCISVLGEDQGTHSRSLGRSGPDKFAQVPYDLSPVTRSPRLTGAVSWLDCSTREIHDGGDHLVVIADVHDLGGEDGARPLAFWRGDYVRIAGVERPA